MCDPILGQIVMFAGNFAPRGWALCDGQLLRINDHQSLYSILGTQFGGDGRTTFALPDLRGRFPMHPGSGPGLSARTVGETGGHETTDLQASNLPNPDKMSVTTPNWLFRPEQIDLDHDNMPPFACVNYIIATEGIFPSRP